MGTLAPCENLPSTPPFRGTSRKWDELARTPTPRPLFFSPLTPRRPPAPAHTASTTGCRPPGVGPVPTASVGPAQAHAAHAASDRATAQSTNGSKQLFGAPTARARRRTSKSFDRWSSRTSISVDRSLPRMVRFGTIDRRTAWFSRMQDRFAMTQIRESQQDTMRAQVVWTPNAHDFGIFLGCHGL